MRRGVQDMEGLMLPASIIVTITYNVSALCCIYYNNVPQDEL